MDPAYFTFALVFVTQAFRATYSARTSKLHFDTPRTHDGTVQSSLSHKRIPPSVIRVLRWPYVSQTAVHIISFE